MSSPLLSLSLLKYVDRDIAMSTSCSYKNKLTQYGRIWKNMEKFQCYGILYFRGKVDWTFLSNAISAAGIRRPGAMRGVKVDLFHGYGCGL